MNFFFTVGIYTCIGYALVEYLAADSGIGENTYDLDFPSSITNIFSESIRRRQAWKFITSFYRDIGLNVNIGEHSLCKT